MRALLLAAALLLPPPQPMTGLGCKGDVEYHVFATASACASGCPCGGPCKPLANPRAGDGPGEPEWYCRCPCSSTTGRATPAGKEACALTCISETRGCTRDGRTGHQMRSCCTCKDSSPVCTEWSHCWIMSDYAP